MHCRNCGHDNLPEARFCASCGAALVATIEPSPAVSEPVSVPSPPVVAMEYAGFWIRFAACLIDILIISAAASVFRFGLSLPMLAGSGGFGITGMIWSSIAGFLPWLYWWLLTGLRGQTLGKMILNIKVVNRQGNKPGLGYAALREIIGKTVSFLVLFLGFLWIAWDKDKRGWHDKIAGTYVVKSK